MWNARRLNLFITTFIFSLISLVPHKSYATNINISADIGGAEVNKFYRDDIVYGAATLGLTPATAYDLYVVYSQSWVDQTAIPAGIAGSETGFTTDGSGDMAAGTLVWNTPHTGGKCDIVIDVDGDGLYDAASDFVDTDVIAGMIVLSEVEIDGSFTNRGEWLVNLQSINLDNSGTYYWRELPSWKGYSGSVSFVIHDIWSAIVAETCDYNLFCFTVNGVDLEVWVFENTDTDPDLDPGWLNPSGLGSTYSSLDDRGFLVRKDGDPGTDAHWKPGDPKPGDAGWNPDSTVGTADDYWGVFAQSGFNDSGYTNGYRSTPSTPNEVYEVAYFNTQLSQINALTCPSSVGIGGTPVSSGCDPAPCPCPSTNCLCPNCEEPLVTLFNEPARTLIELSSFETIYRQGKVTVHWVTESEKNTAGFDIERSLQPNEGYEKLNSSMIPAEGDDITGAEYSFVDKDIKHEKYYYQLKEYELNGKIYYYGPTEIDLRPKGKTKTPKTKKTTPVTKKSTLEQKDKTTEQKGITTELSPLPIAVDSSDTENKSTEEKKIPYILTGQQEVKMDKKPSASILTIWRESHENKQ